jgi:hypothetical protein
LFVKDVFGATETKKCANEQQSTYPLDYPFEDLLEYIASCMDIVKLFYNNQTLKAQLNAEQKKNGVRGLVCPAPTCWGSIKGCCKRLQMSERISHAIVSAKETSSRREQQLRKPSATDARASSQATIL